MFLARKFVDFFFLIVDDHCVCVYRVEYTGVKSLWLEGNGIAKIENISHMHELRCMLRVTTFLCRPRVSLISIVQCVYISTRFLHENLIAEIEGLEGCTLLSTLNVSHNMLTRLSGLSELKELSSLYASHNSFDTYESLMHLKECPSISVLDLSHCHIADTSVVDIFKEMPNLHVLQLNGNPFVRQLRNYRKVRV